MINSRILQIANVLLQKDIYITIDHIAQLLQVSNKTIRNDLKTLEEWLAENELALIKKTGVGIRLEGQKEAKLKIMNIMEEKNQELIEYSPEARKIYIGMRILFAEGTCRIYELSDELYVSRATIHKDILSITPMLESFKVYLNRKNNNGLSIDGTEKNKRNLLLHLMSHDNGYQMFYQIVKQDDYICDGTMVFAGLDQVDDEVQEFIKVMRQVESSYLSSLEFESLVQVLLHCYVSLLRVQAKREIELSSNFLLELKNEPYYEDTKELCHALRDYYHIEFSGMEIRYLQVFLISLRNSTESFLLDDTEAEELKGKIISSLCLQLHLPFDQDQELQSALFAHLCPAITRYRHAIPLENPLKSEIQKLYKNTYRVAKKSIHCIEEKYHCILSEDEIAYYTLHVAAALERMKKPLQSLLVCHGGVGASNLLLQKLTIQIAEINIVSEETFLSINESKLEGIELIISTTQLQLDTTIPILYVNPLLYDYDILRLKDVIKEYYKKKNDPLHNIEDPKE